MKFLKISVFFFILITGLVLNNPNIANASVASNIQTQIDTNKQQINSLEADIAVFQKQLDTLGAKKNTLNSTIRSLAISQKKLAVQIRVTLNKIYSANLQISKLSLSIGDKESSITIDKDVLSKELRAIFENEQTPLLIKLISSNSLSSAWQTVDTAVSFNKALARNIAGLRTARASLGKDRSKVQKEKTKLLALNKNLALQKRSIDVSKRAQQRLLYKTKNKESNYQKLIAKKKASQKAFEAELINLESQLKIAVHPNLLPKTGSGVLSWPFSKSFILRCSKRKAVFGNLFCITQYFGNTRFATKNSQIYNGHGHNGIDIGASIGTPIHAALKGTVLATGNTDLTYDYRGRQCYSFGKWIMLKHNNGINTMYSHLSEINVSKGQYVTTGQVIGLSGMTGYATGPHLHFGVYATEGTKIMTLRQFRGAKIGCADAKMPVATLKAYLNPLSYL